MVRNCLHLLATIHSTFHEDICFFVCFPETWKYDSFERYLGGVAVTKDYLPIAFPKIVRVLETIC